MPSIIHDLELSVRTTNVLNAMDTVQTYDDFMALTKEQVMAQRNAGIRTWREVEEVQQNLRDGHPEVNRMLAQAAPETPADVLTLRDQAALAALPVVIQVCAGDRPREIGTETHEQMFARKAWAVADAFIAAREGKTE